MAPSDTKELPAEVAEITKEFVKSLENISSLVTKVTSTPIEESFTDVLPIDRAKSELSYAFATNSLFWMFLASRGVNPKEHGVKSELDRIKEYMNRVKVVKDREDAPRVNVDAAKRIVKHSLWQLAQKKQHQKADNGEAEAQTETTSAETNRGHEKSDSEEEPSPKRSKQTKGKNKKRKS